MRAYIGIALLFAATSAHAQTCSVTVTPPSAAYGQPILVTLNNPNASTIFLPSSCVIRSIHAGGATGPVVFSPLCATVITPILPGGSHSQTWNQKDSYEQQVPPGNYTVVLDTPFACTAQVTIAPCTSGGAATFGAGCSGGTASTPSLAAESCPVIGAPFALSLVRAPALQPALLVLGASNTSLGGVPLPVPLGGACFLRVSNEVLVHASTSLLGEKRFVFPIPLDPGLQGATAYAQAFVPASTQLATSNAVALTIG